MQTDRALVRGEAVVLLRTMGHLCEALLGPQFWRIVLLRSWLLEPCLIERFALHGRDGWSLQTSIVLDPVILLLIVLARAGGIIGSPDIALAEEL